MAPSSTLTYKLEVEFVPGSGVYVDLSDRVTSLRIIRPPGTRLGEATPTTLEADLLNHPDATGFCPLSPDSPPAARYPNVTRDRLVRVTAVWAGGASTAIRFWGWSDSWIPDGGDRPPATATVALSASCILGRYARRTLLSQYGEYNQQDPDYDYWPLNEAADSTTFKGYAGPGQAVQDATLVLPTTSPGSATLSAPSGGHSTDGEISFTRGDNLAYPSPVILVPTRTDGSVPSSFEAWFRLTTDPTGLNDDAVVAYKSDGTKVWSLNAAIVSGSVQWLVYDNTGSVRTGYNTGAPRDDGWHFLFLWMPNSTSFNLNYSNRGNLYSGGSGTIPTWPYDPRQFNYLVVGGRMLPTARGKQSNTLQGDVSSFRVGYNGDLSSGQGINDPGTPINSMYHKNLLIASGLGVDAYVGGATSTAVDSRKIQPTIAYPNLLDRWNELTRSMLGELITRVDGRRQYSVLGEVRSSTVALTLDAEQDLSAPDGGWVLVKDEVPSRVQVTGPPGSITYTRADVETLTGIRLDGPTIDTACADITGLRAVGAWATYQTGARLRSFGFDPTITSTDKLTAAMALQPRQRIRVTTLPTALNGLSYLDVWAYGWTETFNATDGSCGWQFETWAADDPPEGVYDDAEYGRFALGDAAATATGGTAVGTTAVGTLVLTSTSPITVNAASYPLDLEWAGERVTVTAAPASSTSPQTLTLTARGVAPTVARVHLAGDPVEIWHADRFGV